MAEGNGASSRLP